MASFEQIPIDFLNRIFDTMEQADSHQFQVLTKRSSRLQKFLNNRYRGQNAPSHIWFGVSVENRSAVTRIRHLQNANAAVRFLSIEPLVGPLGILDLSKIDWVIVGGESGPGFRPMKAEWALEVRDQCLERGVPLFFKQWGGVRPKSGGNELDGRVWAQFPQPHPTGSIVAVTHAQQKCRSESRVLGQLREHPAG